ncbi:hypothetical protein GLW00_00540 [Halobacillus litoralis]|uniref:Regulatory protein YycH-like domain-containing protein n=1 Tax=Halobacillus litoralis TaxID=45668 RepID=A0A845F5D6_9BACI|nr:MULTISPECIES: two-component system regulatory protein YycI [Halobacillus]MEC3884286.1 two-component system regulatory protein YycI [Halobacillus sp. HZG1]MYL69313.1 hypothetical protein [Halobacillus litoralis]
MQWGQIKTLFIISFLILDLFLLQQLLGKQAEDEVGQISTVAESIETELEANDISIKDDAIPEELPEATPIESESTHTLPDDVMSMIEGMDESDKEIELKEDNQVLQVTFDEPIEVTEDTIQGVVMDVVPFASRYSYWGWNEEEGAALFFQAKDNKTIYFNNNGYLLLNIVDGELTGYVATLLSFENGGYSGASGETEVTIEPLSAIRILLNNGLIEPGDEITSMDIGYHTSYSLPAGEENETQVFASTWKVTVNGDRNHFLYTFDGTIIEYINEESFISDVKDEHGLISTEAEQTAANENRENN